MAWTIEGILRKGNYRPGLHYQVVPTSEIFPVKSRLPFWSRRVMRTWQAAIGGASVAGAGGFLALAPPSDLKEHATAAVVVIGVGVAAGLHAMVKSAHPSQPEEVTAVLEAKRAIEEHAKSIRLENGPSHFAFTFGGRHVVIMNSAAGEYLESMTRRRHVERMEEPKRRERKRIA